MNYETYQVEDFILDEHFMAWVIDPNEARNQFWDDWIKNHPEKQAIISEARAVILLMDFTQPTISQSNISQLKQRIQKQIQEQKTPEEREAKIIQLGQEQQTATNRARAWRKWIVAASIGVLLGLGFFLWPTSESGFHQTDFAETEQVQLPDGSVITLSANSSLQYDVDQWKAGGAREVWLHGEAFFEIKNAQEMEGNELNFQGNGQFLVHTDLSEIKVLGTTFNVYDRRGRQEVFLEEGKVQINAAVENQDSSLILEPGELATIHPEVKRFEKMPSSSVKATANWQDSIFYFEDIPLWEVAQKLEDFYGVKFIITDELTANRQFTGTLPNDDLELVIANFETIYQIKIKRSDDGVWLEVEEDLIQ